MEVSGKFHATAALPLETTHQIGDYSGPRAVLDVLEKSCVCIYIYIYIYIEREREREREREGGGVLVRDIQNTYSRLT